MAELLVAELSHRTELRRYILSTIFCLAASSNITSCAILTKRCHGGNHLLNVPLNFIAEGDGIEFNGLTFATLPAVDSVKENRGHCNMNGFSSENVVEMQSVKDQQKIAAVIIDDNDYSVGYDYCGIPSDRNNHCRVDEICKTVTSVLLVASMVI